MAPQRRDRDTLPTEPHGALESAQVPPAPYVRCALTHVGDELPEGRVKLIHPCGTVARVHLQVVDTRYLHLLPSRVPHSIDI